MTRLHQILNKYIHKTHLFDMLEFFKDNKINNLYFTKTITLPLNFSSNNLIGGEIYDFNVKIDYQIYKVHIDEYVDNLDENIKTINFIKFDSILNERGDYKEDDHCGVLIIDKKEKISTIQSVTNYTDCVKCLQGEKPFKIGDILTQIMIIISHKKNINKIYLTDNSYLSCYNSKISLIHLRTITRGLPYYSKFGFIPTDEQELDFLKHNKKIFLENRTLLKERIIKFIMYRKFDKIKDNKMLKYINNKLLPRLQKDNSVSEFIKDIINDNCNESCELLYNIYMDVYRYIGYVKYMKRNFVL